MNGIEKVRLVDIAAEVNVSRAVVGRVLLGSGSSSIGVSERKARLIRDVAGRMGYQPNRVAQQLRGVRSKIIGVLSEISPSQVSEERLDCLAVEADKHGYRIIIGRIAGSQNNIVPYLNDFLSRGCETFVFLRQLPDADGKLQEYLKNIPIPVLCCEDEFQDIPFFSIDRADGIRQAIDHLHAKNYRRIGIIVSDRKISTMIQRLKGYEGAMAENIPGLAKKLIYSADIQYAPKTEAPEWKELTKQAVKHLVLNQKADAIIAPDDIWACHLMRELQSRGLSVPQAIGIVGFDNTQPAMLYSPSITSIDQNSHEFAAQVMNFISNFENGGDLNKNTRLIIKPQLVTRESTARI